MDSVTLFVSINNLACTAKLLQGRLREDPDAQHQVVDGVQLREDEPLPDRPPQGQVRHLLRHALQRLRLHKGR